MRRIRAMATVLCALAGAARAEDEADTAAARAEHLEKVVREAVERSDPGDGGVLSGISARWSTALELKAARILRTTKVDFDVEKQPVAAVLNLFAKTSGLNFIMSAKAREALEADKAQLTFRLAGLPLENVVNLAADQLGDYRFIVRYGAVMLVRKEEYRPRTRLVVYDVSDIVRPRPDFPAPTLGLEQKKN